MEDGGEDGWIVDGGKTSTAPKNTTHHDKEKMILRWRSGLLVNHETAIRVTNVVMHDVGTALPIDYVPISHSSLGPNSYC